MIQENYSKQEDEINFKELWSKIFNSKLKIFMTTGIITISAMIYSYKLPKVYQVTAMLQIGYNKNTLIENASSLVKKLEVTTGMISRKKREFPLVDSVSAVRGTTDLIKLSVLSFSNESALRKINETVNNIINDHKKIISERITIANEQLIGIANQRNYLLSEINEIKKAILKEHKKNITLASLILLKDLNAQLLKIDEYVQDLKDSISENSLKNSKLIGDVNVGEAPIKPNKKLIVIVAFMTGLILSILSIFFLEFISKFKEENFESATQKS